MGWGGDWYTETISSFFFFRSFSLLSFSLFFYCVSFFIDFHFHFHFIIIIECCKGELVDCLASSIRQKTK